MKLDKNDLSISVNNVMADMFYLSPDLDEHGRLKRNGRQPGEGVPLHMPLSDSMVLQWIYEWELLQLMTANLTALPPDELPADWVRQSAREASWVIWGYYITSFQDSLGDSITMITPQPAEERLDPETAQWHFNFYAESRQLHVSLIEQADL